VIRYLLDTDICIGLLRGTAGQAFERMRRRPPEVIGISAITLAELHHGLCKLDRRQAHLHRLIQFCAPLAIAPFDDAAAMRYGQVRAALEEAGTPIGPLDTLIAGHALALRATLVTHNVREFKRVAGLRVEDWLKA
jgi:tRNA(fMet)-specific endonuclease VapC